MNPKANRERLTKMMFEEFQVPAMYVAVGAVLSLYASKRNSGIVLDCGHTSSRVVPIYEGHVLPHATLFVNVAGKDANESMQKMLHQRGYHFSYPVGEDIAGQIMEELSYD